MSWENSLTSITIYLCSLCGDTSLVFVSHEWCLCVSCMEFVCVMCGVFVCYVLCLCVLCVVFVCVVCGVSAISKK